MARPELALAAFRRFARLTLLLSVALTVAGLYAALHGQWGPALLALGAGILLLYPAQYVRIRPQPGSEDVLVFVTKRDCSLCDEARLLLPQVVAGTPFRVEEAAVEDDRLLRRHFRRVVPVLLWQGEEVARLRWDADAIRTRLRAILASRPPPPPGQNP